MFGKIIKVESNILTVVNESRTAHSEIIGYHVIFETTERKVVGEILEMDTEIVKILLVGEIILGVFSPGVVKKPNSDCIPRIVNTDELELIIGKRTSTREYLILGNSPIYTNFPVSVKINNLFATHSAIIGNTGSGKSCGVARMLQNLFLSNQEKPINSHIILFDAYGEYVRTFEELNTIPKHFAIISFLYSFTFGSVLVNTYTNFNVFSNTGIRSASVTESNIAKSSTPKKLTGRFNNSSSVFCISVVYFLNPKFGIVFNSSNVRTYSP